MTPSITYRHTTRTKRLKLCESSPHLLANTYTRKYTLGSKALKRFITIHLRLPYIVSPRQATLLLATCRCTIESTWLSLSPGAVRRRHVPTLGARRVLRTLRAPWGGPLPAPGEIALWTASCPAPEIRVWGLGFRVWGLGSKSSEFRVWGLEFCRI